LIEVRQTDEYEKWFDSLRDRQAKARIDIRVRRLSLGNPGDAKPVGEGVSELRIDYGPGYRVYFVQRADVLIVLLAGGDKRTQDQDIRIAKQVARDLQEYRYAKDRHEAVGPRGAPQDRRGHGCLP
jgi:putative addiction module killer protein